MIIDTPLINDRWYKENVRSKVEIPRWCDTTVSTDVSELYWESEHGLS